MSDSFKKKKKKKVLATGCYFLFSTLSQPELLLNTFHRFDMPSTACNSLCIELDSISVHAEPGHVTSTDLDIDEKNIDE